MSQVAFAFDDKHRFVIVDSGQAATYALTPTEYRELADKMTKIADELEALVEGATNSVLGRAKSKLQ